MRSTKHKAGVALALCSFVALLVAGWATGARQATEAAPVGSGKQTAKKSVCGLGTGKKATGTPIKVGGLVTFEPGTDFQDIAKAAAAYFTCVNDNGGIRGRPIQYKYYTTPINPVTVAAQARKLVADKVWAVVGNTEILDCTVNHKYYRAQGYYVIGSGIAPECYNGAPTMAQVNMGPAYSATGAAQALVRAGAKKLVCDTSNQGDPTGYVNLGCMAVATNAGLEAVDSHHDVPITDAASVALELVQRAGQDGGIVLTYIPPEALKILQAAQQQGLIDRVKWGCATPCNTDFVAAELGSAWNGKLHVNAELALLDSKGPDMTLYRAVMGRYASSTAIGSFSQMGFIEAMIATSAMLNAATPLSKQTINRAIRDVKNYKTDILCKPWYFGVAPYHNPNNTDRTVWPQNGKMVQKEGCFNIYAYTPQLQNIRKWETQRKLNTGSPAYPRQGKTG
jgi:branched-chain amino acid transport system substrate-binding protein